MICSFFFGCAIGMTFHYWLMSTPTANRVGKCGRTSIDVSGYFAGVDLNVPEGALDALRGDELVTLRGRLDGPIGIVTEASDAGGSATVELGWPFDTITEDAVN